MVLKLLKNRKTGLHFVGVCTDTPLGFNDHDLLIWKLIPPKEYRLILKKVAWNKNDYIVVRKHVDVCENIQTYIIAESHQSYNFISKL